MGWLTYIQSLSHLHELISVWHCGFLFHFCFFIQLGKVTRTILVDIQQHVTHYVYMLLLLSHCLLCKRRLSYHLLWCLWSPPLMLTLSLCIDCLIYAIENDILLSFTSRYSLKVLILLCLILFTNYYSLGSGKCVMKYVANRERWYESFVDYNFCSCSTKFYFIEQNSFKI